MAELRPFAGFPNYQQTVPGYPYANAVEQLMASMKPPPAGPYGRFAGASGQGGLGGAPVAGGGMLGLPSAPGNVGPPGFNNGGMMGLPTTLANGLTGVMTPGGMNYTPSNPGMVANGSQWSPPAAVPTNFSGTGNTPFALDMGTSSSGANPMYANMDAARARMIANNPGSQLGAPMPQTITVSQFNQLAQANPMLAESLYGRAGQDFRDAVMQANGWSNNESNQWINSASYGSLGGNRDGIRANEGLLRALGLL